MLLMVPDVMTWLRGCEKHQELLPYAVQWLSLKSRHLPSLLFPSPDVDGRRVNKAAEVLPGNPAHSHSAALPWARGHLLVHLHSAWHNSVLVHDGLPEGSHSWEASARLGEERGCISFPVSCIIQLSHPTVLRAMRDAASQSCADSKRCPAHRTGWSIRWCWWLAEALRRGPSSCLIRAVC